MATEVTCIVDTDSGAGYDYTSLNAALVGEAGGSPVVVAGADLVTNDERLIIECRASSGSADTAAADVTGFTTGSDDYVKIHTVGGQRHAGVWDASIYRLTPSAGSSGALGNGNAYTQLVGLQVENTATGAWGVIGNAGLFGAYSTVDSCIARYQGTGEYVTGITAPDSSHTGLVARNNIVYGMATTGSYGIYVRDETSASYLVNNTVVGCTNGIRGRSGSGLVVAINNLSRDNTADWADSGFDLTNSAYNAFSNSGASCPGSSDVDVSSYTAAQTFEDAANDDYHLSAAGSGAAALKGVGVGPASNSNVPTTDIDGDTRSGTTTDIGADLYVASGVNLIIADSTHGHAADSIALTQAHVLAIAEALHGHTADNLTLTQAHALVVSDSTHAHAADSIALTQAHVLVLQDADHAHGADNITLTAAGDLVVADSTHTHTADNITLTQAHALAIAEALHGHTADVVVLSAGLALVIAEATHAHAADSPALSQAHLLAIQEALHAQGADNIDLTQAHTLIVSDALHAHLADACNLYPGVIQTADERTLVVRAEGRTLVVTTEDRTLH